MNLDGVKRAKTLSFLQHQRQEESGKDNPASYHVSCSPLQQHD
jgi:hypothetical protein